MIFRLHQLPTVLALLLLGSSLAGCASMNEKASAALGDYVPQWAGGLPADAPPRPGTAKYDEWMKERERLREMPADKRPPDAQAQASSSATTKPFASNSSSSTSKPASNTSTSSTTSATSSGSTPSGLAPVH